MRENGTVRWNWISITRIGEEMEFDNKQREKEGVWKIWCKCGCIVSCFWASDEIDFMWQ